MVRGRKLDPESAAMRDHIRQRVVDIEATIRELEILLAQIHTAKKREQKNKGRRDKPSPAMKLLDTLASQNDVVAAQTRRLETLHKHVFTMQKRRNKSSSPSVFPLSPQATLLPALRAEHSLSSVSEERVEQVRSALADALAKKRAKAAAAKAAAPPVSPSVVPASSPSLPVASPAAAKLPVVSPAQPSPAAVSSPSVVMFKPAPVAAVTKPAERVASPLYSKPPSMSSLPSGSGPASALQVEQYEDEDDEYDEEAEAYEDEFEGEYGTYISLSLMYL